MLGSGVVVEMRAAVRSHRNGNAVMCGGDVAPCPQCVSLGGSDLGGGSRGAAARIEINSNLVRAQFKKQ